MKKYSVVGVTFCGDGGAACERFAGGLPSWDAFRLAGRLVWSGFFQVAFVANDAGRVVLVRDEYGARICFTDSGRAVPV